MTKHRGLGKGLASLIPTKKPIGGFTPSLPVSASQKRDEDTGTNLAQRFLTVSPHLITANPYQPRTEFEEKALADLAASIKEHGILSPLIVTQKGEGYELIAGERRLRAACDLGMKKVPVIVRESGEAEKFVLALIENIQRENLNSLELARGYTRLMEEFLFTQEALAKKLGRSRSHVANVVRLLELPTEIQLSLERGEITEGHAKVILSVVGADAQLQLWQKITMNRLPVRVAEHEARYIKVKSHNRRMREDDPYILRKEQALEAKLGTKVAISGSKEKGRITIDYFSAGELERIVDSL